MVQVDNRVERGDVPGRGSTRQNPEAGRHRASAWPRQGAEQRGESAPWAAEQQRLIAKPGEMTRSPAHSLARAGDRGRVIARRT